MFLSAAIGIFILSESITWNGCLPIKQCDKRLVWVFFLFFWKVDDVAEWKRCVLRGGHDYVCLNFPWPSFGAMGVIYGCLKPCLSETKGAGGAKKVTNRVKNAVTKRESLIPILLGSSGNLSGARPQQINSKLPTRCEKSNFWASAVLVWHAGVQQLNQSMNLHHSVHSAYTSFRGPCFTASRV